jgi:hypothetical protein
MRQWLRSHLTFANVCSLAALFVALGGTAYANHEQIFSNDIVDGEVKTVDMGAGAVKRGKLATDAVNSAKVADGSLTGADLANGAVGTAQLQDLGVTAEKLADRAVTNTKIGFFAVSTLQIRPGAVSSSKMAESAVDADALNAINDRTKDVTVGGRNFASGTATCNSGEQIISGGVSGTGAVGVGEPIDVRVSHRDGNGWRVHAENHGSSTQEFTVHAYCLNI